ASCARVVQQAPDDVDALVERGCLAVLAGQPAEGEQWLTRAVAAAPGNREAQYSLYQCLERQGKQEEARRHLDQANQITADLRWMEALNKKLAEAPDDAAVRHDMGQLLLSSGHENRALIWFKSALELDPQHRPTLS